MNSFEGEPNPVTGERQFYEAVPASPSDILNYLFPERVEPTAERCSACHVWFRSEELSFCQAEGEPICLGCTRECEACEDKLCPSCFGSREVCTGCIGNALNRRAVSRL